MDRLLREPPIWFNLWPLQGPISLMKSSIAAPHKCASCKFQEITSKFQAAFVCMKSYYSTSMLENGVGQRLQNNIKFQTGFQLLKIIC